MYDMQKNGLKNNNETIHIQFEYCSAIGYSATGIYGSNLKE